MKNDYEMKEDHVEIIINSRTYGEKRLLIDPTDLERVKREVTGTVTLKKGSKEGVFYAAFTKNSKHYFMHRFILDYEGPLVVDHINGNGLDNRKNNLRLATISQNAQNISSNSNSSSGIKGLVYDPNKKKWRVRVKLMGKVKFEHFYHSKEKAIEVLNRKLDKYHEYRHQLED